MRTLVVLPALVLLTVFWGSVAIVAQLVGLPDGPGTIYERAPRHWARALLALSGVRVVIHGAERMHTGEPRIFASNHTSWYDVLVLVAHLPRCSFVAKAELFRVPLFGAAARAVGTVPIERDNRRAAFQSYDEAAARIRAGRNVVVFPEGTRGAEYSLRPFKKGPFVLAVTAGVPVVPTVLHGTIDVLPRGSFWLRPGRVHVHLLEPVDAAGLSYDDRDALGGAVHGRMADALRREYGVESPAFRAEPAPGRVDGAPALAPVPRAAT
jgi:1-acyl-sn-glycerol-3-phosphate acyltransferase